MTRIFHLANPIPHDPAIDAWFLNRPPILGDIARHWFEVMRACNGDFRETLHDGHPTACVGTAAFTYVNTFSAHVNVGFFLGAHIPDPAGLLKGTGKFMRHVSLRPGEAIDESALTALINVAYEDMRGRIESG